MEDNRKVTHLAMALFIYHNVPDGMRGYNSENLKKTIDTDGDDWYPSSIEFKRKTGADNSDTNEVTLSIEDLERWDFTTVEDDDGNMWKKTRYHFSVCWSSFSRCFRMDRRPPRAWRSGTSCSVLPATISPSPPRSASGR